MFTYAERKLLDIALMRPGAPISDDKWREMSGLDEDPDKGARMKELAIKGLREKGLTIQGKGKTATYRFDTDHWETYWRSQPRRDRARTSGRAPTVKAKPGMMVHEACKDQCQKLCEENAKCGMAEVISISSGQQNAKPISRNPPESERENAKPISRFETQVVDSITTPNGNKVPVEHLEVVNAALLKARRRIENATHGKKALEAHIIRDEIARITATKTASAQTQTKQQRDKEIKAARAILDWKEPEHEEDRKFARDKGMYPDAKTLQWARDVIAGSGQ